MVTESKGLIKFDYGEIWTKESLNKLLFLIFNYQLGVNELSSLAGKELLDK